MKNVVITNTTHSLGSPLRASYCFSFLCRLRGLTFCRKIPRDQGLLLVQPKDSRLDSSIHMVFVFFDLGIIWINETGEVVDKCHAKRWITMKVPNKPARYTLEIVPERLHEFQLGDSIRFEDPSSN